MTLGVDLSLSKKNRKREEQSQEHAWKELVSNLDQADGPGWWHERTDDWKEDVAVPEGAHERSSLRTACRSLDHAALGGPDLNQTSSIGKVVHQRGDELIWCLSLDRSKEVQRLCAFWERHEDALRLRATFAMLLRELFACAAIHCLSFIDVTRTVHPAARDTLIFAATPITPTSVFSHGESIEMGLS